MNSEGIGFRSSFSHKYYNFVVFARSEKILSIQKNNFFYDVNSLQTKMDGGPLSGKPVIATEIQLSKPKQWSKRYRTNPFYDVCNFRQRSLSLRNRRINCRQGAWKLSGNLNSLSKLSQTCLDVEEKVYFPHFRKNRPVQSMISDCVVNRANQKTAVAPQP